jgi:hypothetical protein
MNLTALEQATLSRKISQIGVRIKRMEDLFNGKPIATVMFMDAIITSAKIASISAGKITTEEMNIGTNIYIGSVASGNYIKKSASDLRIVQYIGGIPRIIIGEVDGAMVVRVSLPGYNAETDDDPDHFALYSDQDWILIKEFERGDEVVVSGGSKTITHDLGYVPLVMVYSKSGDTWSIVDGEDIDVTTTTLKVWLTNGTRFKYYIFYDNQL